MTNMNLLAQRDISFSKASQEGSKLVNGDGALMRNMLTSGGEFDGLTGMGLF